MPAYEILIPITYHYHWELRPFLKLFNRFWGKERIAVLSDEDPIIDQVEWYPVRLCLDKNGWSDRFSSNLRAYLTRDCQAEFVIILMGDYWLTAPVKLTLLRLAIDYMASHRDIIRLQIGSGMSFDHTQIIDRIGDLEIRDRPDFLKGSLIPAVWSRELLLKYLPIRQNLWSTETELTRIINENPVRSLLAWPIIYDYQNIVQTRHRRADFRLFPLELSAEVIDLIPEDFAITAPRKQPPPISMT